MVTAARGSSPISKYFRIIRNYMPYSMICNGLRYAIYSDAHRPSAIQEPQHRSGSSALLEYRYFGYSNKNPGVLFWTGAHTG